MGGCKSCCGSDRGQVWEDKKMAGVPFDQMNGQIWYNGEFVDWADAKVHVLTHGLHYASSVFEGERAYGGVIFKSREHSERLHNSASILDFKIPFSVDEIEAAKREVLSVNSFTDAYVRPVAWRGSEMMGVSAQSNRINLAIAAWQWPSYFKPEEKLKGIRLDIAKYRRPDPADTTRVIVPSVWPRVTSGTIMADLMPSDRTSSICSASGAMAASSSSDASG